MALQIVLLEEVVEVDSRDAHTILTMLKHIESQNQKLMTALEAITQGVTDNTSALVQLTASVDAAVSHIGNPGATDMQLAALTQALAANTSNTVAQAKRLDAAVAAVPPAPTPAA